MPISKEKFLPILASFPASLYIHFVGKTNRFHFEGPDFHALLKEKKGPYIFALWHNRVMLPLHPYRNMGITVIVSQSKDGEYITQLMKRFGFDATRGSASRHGSEGLLGLIRCLKKGNSVVVTPDGPRGPRERVLPGVVQLSKLSGVPVIPISFSCTRHYRFKSWDRFMLPLPFGTIQFMSGPPIEIPKKMDDAGFEEKRLELELGIQRVTNRVDQLTGTEILEPLDLRESQ